MAKFEGNRPFTQYHHPPQLQAQSRRIWINHLCRDSLMGIATSGGVESTPRRAYDLGYNLVLIHDAMTDRDSDTHHHCVDSARPTLPATP
jgi:nicotinamidase-related amidase